MDNFRVEVDPAWIEQYVADWATPLGEQILELTDEVLAMAKILVPISQRGSKYAPPGFLSSRIAMAQEHDNDGSIMGMVGIPLKAGNRYPYTFIHSASGTRQIRNQYSMGAKKYRPSSGHPYTYGSMFASNDFLFESLTSVAGSRSLFGSGGSVF